MFSKIKKLLAIEDYKVFIKSVKILCLDAIFHGIIFSSFFLILIDLVSDNIQKKKLLIYAVVMATMMIARYFVLTKGYNLSMREGAVGIAHLRIRIGDYINGLNMGFFNKNNIGELTNTTTNDLKDFETLTTHLVPVLVKNGILTVYLLGCVIWANKSLGMYHLLVIVVTLPLAYFCSKAIKKAGYDGKKVRAEMLSKIIEYVTGIEIFKSYNMAGEKFKKLSKSLEDVKKTSIQIELSAIPYIIPLNGIIFLSFPLLLYKAFSLYTTGVMTAIDLIIYIVISLAFTNVAMGFFVVYIESAYFLISIDKLLNILSIPQIPYEIEEYEFSDFKIEFKDVDFSYITDKKVLKNINFIAEPNKITALVGASGSGKSTVLSLIARFWDVDSGSINIGNMDIKKIKPDNLLTNISMVFQDVYLLEDTIYENILIGKQDATREEVIEAAKNAHCHEFIMELEDGYDTLIHEGGSSLSGGEKQRISIARAFLKDSPIVLLDEATASLDVDNEYLIQESFKKLIKDKTVLIIAHRLNTIKDSDQIIVFDDGEIIETGNHEELININGKYKYMYETLTKAKDWTI